MLLGTKGVSDSTRHLQFSKFSDEALDLCLSKKEFSRYMHEKKMFRKQYNMIRHKIKVQQIWQVSKVRREKLAVRTKIFYLYILLNKRDATGRKEGRKQF